MVVSSTRERLDMMPNWRKGRFNTLSHFCNACSTKADICSLYIWRFLFGSVESAELSCLLLCPELFSMTGRLQLYPAVWVLLQPGCLLLIKNYYEKGGGNNNASQTLANTPVWTPSMGIFLNLIVNYNYTFQAASQNFFGVITSGWIPRLFWIKIMYLETW